LAIVRHLVELHGGAVRAESEGEGKGATFILELPMSAAHAANQQVLRLHPTSSSGITYVVSPVLEGLRVLVVDDDPDARQLIRAILEGCSAKVTTAASASEALTIIEQGEIDVLVSDIEMPGEDGYALLRQLRAMKDVRQRRIPAAALTAYARSEDRHRALVEGYQIHLPKPVEPAELVAVVASLAGRPGKLDDGLAP
ncbi:MAG TPA: response regulator, partial [Thermoanaerobaculia bacterium]|nr:response regulator [Thermoanaerobaculia bacterium]